MPTILEWKGWKFLFYSSDRAEPPHVHVRKDRKEAKFWLDNVVVARNARCSATELNALTDVVAQNRERFLEAWNEHFRG